MKGKIKSFELGNGTRIGNYCVLDNIGRGWESEVYRVAEVPTESIRALKLFRTDELESIRHLVHYAWFYEQIRPSGSVPVYYHYGQWFLDDDNGCWYLIFEFVPGLPLQSAEPSEQLFLKVARAMSRVHKLGYALGDISMANVVVRESDGEPVFVDCDPGEPDNPNVDFRSDCAALSEIAEAMFRHAMPAPVSGLLDRLDQKHISNSTLSQLLD